MDNEKTLDSLTRAYNKFEKGVVKVVQGQANFILRLRKYTTNEDPSTINKAITFGIKMNIAIIIVEVTAIVFLDIYSNYGIMSKVFTLFLLYWLKTIFREE